MNDIKRHFKKVIKYLNELLYLWYIEMHKCLEMETTNMCINGITNEIQRVERTTGAMIDWMKIINNFGKSSAPEQNK